MEMLLVMLAAQQWFASMLIFGLMAIPSKPNGWDTQATA
jgi:hypothetical protein